MTAARLWLTDIDPRMAAKLDQMSALPEGWHFGDGVPITRAAITEAQTLAMLAHAMGLATDAFPAIDGGCSIAIYNGENRLELIFDAQGEIRELHSERGIGDECNAATDPIENPSGGEVGAHLRALQAEQPRLWKSPDSSTFVSSTADSGRGAQPHLLTRVLSVPLQIRPTIEEGSRSSRPRVHATG